VGKIAKYFKSKKSLNRLKDASSLVRKLQNLSKNIFPILGNRREDNPLSLLGNHATSQFCASNPCFPEVCLRRQTTRLPCTFITITLTWYTRAMQSPNSERCSNSPCAIKSSFKTSLQISLYCRDQSYRLPYLFWQ
jgi:hypothetical protein